MAAILKAWRHIRNPTPSIDVSLHEEESRQISSWSDLKRRSVLDFFLKMSLQHKNNKKKKKEHQQEAVN